MPPHVAFAPLRVVAPERSGQLKTSHISSVLASGAGELCVLVRVGVGVFSVRGAIAS